MNCIKLFVGLTSDVGACQTLYFGRSTTRGKAMVGGSEDISTWLKLEQ